MKPIVILGAGRHGRGAVEILDGLQMAVAGFLDDTKPTGEPVSGRPVLGAFATMRDLAFVRDHAWFVAVGDNYTRRTLCRELADADASFASVIHPSAQISPSATLGRGLYIGACSVVQTGSIVGDWALLGAHAYVGIDGSVGDAAFVGHGSILAAGTSVGACTFLGSGAIMANDASVGADCTVGAGSVVTRALPDGSTAYGVPARPAPITRRPFKR
jgi:sugar O-acyltransferase (sialic acid O-acetyltransferase NeuD family)